MTNPTRMLVIVSTRDISLVCIPYTLTSVLAKHLSRMSVITLASGFSPASCCCPKFGPREMEPMKGTGKSGV